MSEGIDLFGIFNAVSGALQDKRSVLNEADSYNQNHGDNMVQIFEVITQAMKEKKGADPADQLQYASDLLRGASNSGSAQMYVRGLSDASKEAKGKGITIENILTLVQMLLNGGKTPAASSSGDMLGSLLTGLVDRDGGNSGGMDMGSLISAGMSLLNAQGGGDLNIESLAEKLVSGSAMGESKHRSQSGQVVANTVLQLLSNLEK